MQPFRNMGLSSNSKSASRSQSVLPAEGTFSKPEEIKPYFTKMVDGRQVFIEDKVIFPKLLKNTMKMGHILDEQRAVVDDIHHELNAIDHHLKHGVSGSLYGGG
jgi:hypothetical protein